MMGLQKNITSQKWRVFAFDKSDGTPKTGDAANITAKIAKDWGTRNATNDVAPTEAEDGYYLFDLTQAETNADNLDLYPQSGTANIVVVGVPGSILTSPASFPDDVIQTGDSFVKVDTEIAALVAAVITNAAGADVAADIIALKTVADAIPTTAMRGTDSALTDKAGFSLSTAGILAIWHQTLTAIATAGSIGKLFKDEITAARMATLTDWIDGGRLDLLINDIQSRLPAALLSGRMNSDVIAVVGETGAATRLSRFFLAGRHGTAQGGSAGTITLASGAISDDDFFNGSTIVLTANTGRRQFRLIMDSVASTDVATITPDWVVNPDATTEYVIIPFGLSDAVAISGSVAAADAVTEVRLAELDVGNLPTDIAAIPTTMRGTDGANTTTPPTVVAIADQVFDEATSGHVGAGSFGKLLADVLADSNELQVDNLPGLIAALNDVASGDILTTALTESYAAKGATATLTQLLYMILALISERSIVTTTQTSKKLDGSTTAMTHTLDDASTPTSVTRAT